MSPLPDLVLSRVAAALSGSDAEEALQQALATLLAAGFVAHSAEAGVAWLQVEHAGRVVALDVGLQPADEALRETLRSLLSAALMRAAAEDELRRTRERMDMLSAASFEGLFVHVDGVIIDANQRVAELTGYPLAEVLGPNTLRNCVAPEDLPRCSRRMKNRFEGAYVITGVRKDGSRFRAELQSKQGKLGTRPVRVVAVRDVTERERTQALLLESEARLRDLAQRTFDFIVFSRNGVALEVAGALERVLGFKPSDWVGKRLIDTVAPGSVPLGTRLLAEQVTGSNELTLLSKTGDQVPVEIVSVMSTLDGEPVRVGAVRDLRPARRLEDERRSLYEQLQRSQRLGEPRRPGRRHRARFQQSLGRCARQRRAATSLSPRSGRPASCATPSSAPPSARRISPPSCSPTRGSATSGGGTRSIWLPCGASSGRCWRRVCRRTLGSSCLSEKAAWCSVTVPR